MIVKPDLSDASLHILHTSELTPHNFGIVNFQSYRICEDTLVSFWNHSNDKCGAYTGLTSVHFTNDVFACFIRCNHSLCPASGRFVYFAFVDDANNNDNGRIVVVDFTI